MPKSKKGRAGASNTGDRAGTGKRKLSSTSSNPVLQRSPPSVSNRTKTLPSGTSGERQQSSVAQPTAEQLRFVRPRQHSPPPPLRTSVERPSSQQSHPLQQSNNSRMDRLVPRAQEDDPYEEEEGDEVEEEEEAEGEQEAEEEAEAEEGDVEDEGDYNHQHVGEVFNLNTLLATPGRDDYLQRLSPIKGEGLWFGRDDEVTAKCAKIVQDKFDGPWYSWSVIPKHIQDRYFIEFAVSVHVLYLRAGF